jgi:fumarylacetoacetate (FAA) hydrolase
VRLASLPQGRDGRLIVVSDDLVWYADADHIVPTLQALLDSWDRYAPLLESLSIELAHGAIPRKRFHEREAAAPLPRSHGRFGGSDILMGARDAFVLADEAWSAVFAPAVVVVTGDVPQGADAEAACACIELVGFANEVTLHAHPAMDGPVAVATHCSPVFATPETLGDAWGAGSLKAPLAIEHGGTVLHVSAADLDFGAALARLAAARPIRAGSLVGLTLPGAGGAALRHGETVRVDVRDGKGHTLFGAIEQKVVRY